MNMLQRAGVLALLLLLVAACAPTSLPVIPATTAASTPTFTPPPPIPTSTRTATLAPLTITLSVSPTPTGTPTPRLATSQYELVTLPIRAFQMADDDGGRKAAITPAQIQQWVRKANEVFAVVGLRLTFDPQQDFSELRSTLLNNLAGVSDSRWFAEVAAGDELAAQHPGQLVVFFRHGPGEAASGEAFSWYDYNFIAMPGWEASAACDAPQLSALAQAVGHYLGLPHTYAAIFATKAEAEAFFNQHGSDPNVFDGDGLSDTGSDPFIATDFIQCQSVPIVQMGKSEFFLPRSNVMSRYAGGFELSAQQVTQARQMLGLRLQNGLSMPTNRTAPNPIQAEALTISKQVECAPEIQNMSPWGAQQWSENQQMLVNANNGGTLALALPVEQAGRYRLEAYLTFAPNYGQVQISLDGNRLGAPLDFYSPLVRPSGPVALGTFELAAGEHSLAFVAVGRNENSPSFRFGLDAFALVPVP